MSRKHWLSKRLATAQSLAANYASDPINCNGVDTVTFMAKTSSVTDNTGEFTVQWRPIESANKNIAGTYVVLTLSPVAVLADANDYFVMQVSPPPGQVRLVFTAAGGTPDGTAELWVTAKTEGA